MASPAQSSTFGFSNIFIKPTTANMQSDLNTFAARSNNLADQILSQHEPKAYTGPVIIHDYHYYHPSPFFWYDPSPRVVVVNPRPISQKDKDKDNAVLIGVIATVVGGIALYYLGASIAGYQDATQELDDTTQFQRRLASYAENASDHNQNKINAAGHVAYLNGRICSRIRNSCIVDIALRTAMVGACGLALAGAITTTPAYMTAGAIAGVVTTGIMLFKWGFNGTDRSNIRDAYALKESLKLMK